MTRINVRNAENRSLAWDKKASALVFAALLIIVSVTVGCSSDKPKPVSSTDQIPAPEPQAQVQPMPAPMVQAKTKPAPKKPVVHKKPATVNYTDKTYGVMFEYPRRYAIETGDAAAELLLSNPVPMNFIQPGGIALAAVELPEIGRASCRERVSCTRQSDSKYFHIYQNGACYEFALNVTTDASAEGLVKHVDRDKVFNRLAQILATVKINPVAPEVTAEAPSPAAPQTPAQ